MLYKDNDYTKMLAFSADWITSQMVETAQVGFLANGSLIFGDVVNYNDERLKSYDESSEEKRYGSALFIAASEVLSSRTKEMESQNYSESELNNIEPTYLYLENVSIRTGNYVYHLSELALKISSIDGVFAGSINNPES